jgi:hypothetical protein
MTANAILLPWSANAARLDRIRIDRAFVAARESGREVTEAEIAEAEAAMTWVRETVRMRAKGREGK